MRALEVQDVPDIVRMLQDLRLESPVYNYVDNDPEFVMNNLDTLIYSGTMVGVMEPRKGFMIGSVSHTWYSRRVEAMEQLLYIKPHFRGGTLAVRLIKAFEQECSRRGAYQLSAGASTGIAEHKTINLYKHLGYNEHTPVLIKRL